MTHCRAGAQGKWILIELSTGTRLPEGMSLNAANDDDDAADATPSCKGGTVEGAEPGGESFCSAGNSPRSSQKARQKHRKIGNNSPSEKNRKFLTLSKYPWHGI
ncbi:hypothetical protein ACLKA7_009052 [Drosophila subpalustris]